MEKEKNNICRTCGTPIDSDYNFCLYCGREYTIQLTDNSIINDNSLINEDHQYQNWLLKRIKSIELKTYSFDGEKCIAQYQKLGDGHQLFENYIYIDDFVGYKPEETTNITVRINDNKEIDIPIQVPITIKPLNIGIKLTDNFRIKANMKNEYASSLSKDVNFFNKGNL